MWRKSEKKYLKTIVKLKEIGESLPPPPGQNWVRLGKREGGEKGGEDAGMKYGENFLGEDTFPLSSSSSPAAIASPLPRSKREEERGSLGFRVYSSRGKKIKYCCGKEGEEFSNNRSIQKH